MTPGALRVVLLQEDDRCNLGVFGGAHGADEMLVRDMITSINVLTCEGCFSVTYIS